MLSMREMSNLWLKIYCICNNSQVHKVRTELGRGHGRKKLPLGSPQPLSIYCQQGEKTVSHLGGFYRLGNIFPFSFADPNQQNGLASFVSRDILKSFNF